MRNLCAVAALIAMIGAMSVIFVDGICADVDRQQIHEPVPYVLASEVHK